jgi:8-oxo-dGTP diphosphatase
MSEPAPSPKVKRVVAGILVRGEEVLCCQRSVHDPMPLKWEFPGGKIEPNETPEQALARELTEELDIQADIGPFIETIRHSYKPDLVIELHFFQVLHWRGEIKNQVFADVRWVKRAEMPNLEFLEADLPLVRAIAAGKKLS